MSIFNNVRLYVNTQMLHMASTENMEAQASDPSRYWRIFGYSTIFIISSKFLNEDEKKWY